jgi:UDP-glucose 4-epimerase
MNRVMIVGAKNPLGEQLIRDLLEDPNVAHVLAVDRNTDNHAVEQQEKLSYASYDLTNATGVHGLLFGPALEQKIDIIVHLATSRDAYGTGETLHAQNVTLLRGLLAAAPRHPTIKRLVLRSFSEVYSVSMRLPTLIREDHPLNLSANAPQYIRDRVEADLTATSLIGNMDLEIAILRCAEALGPGTGSQLYDYLNAPVALRPAGFDPMLNVATIKDLSTALHLAAHSTACGVFNIPGFDTLPLSLTIKKWGTPGLALPELLVKPLYKARHRLMGSQFRYGLNRKRMHYGVVLDGKRAKELLNYTPSHPVGWPTT